MIKIFSILFLAIGIFSDKRKRSKRVKNPKLSYSCSEKIKGKCYYGLRNTGFYGWCDTNDCDANGISKIPEQ